MSLIDVSKLTAEERRTLRGKLGAYAMHEKHPGLAREAGRKGGLAAAANNPHRKSSAHGRALAAAKSAKRNARVLLAEAEVIKERKNRRA